MKISGLILAAGSSKRLGRPKQLVTYGGKTLLSRAIDLLKCSKVQGITVVLGANFSKIVTEIDTSNVEIVENRDWKAGVGASLSCGVKKIASSSDAEGVLVMLADQPKITVDHINGLITLANNAIIVASGYNKINGVPAVFPRRFFPDLMKLTHDHGARKVIKDNKEKVKTIWCEPCSMDIDTTTDLNRLRRGGVGVIQGSTSNSKDL